MIKFAVSLFSLLLLCSVSLADSPGALRAEMDTMDQINYSVGYQIGRDFKKQEVEMRQQTFIRGINDALNGTRPPLTKGEMKLMLMDLKQRIVKERNVKRERHHLAGLKFLSENAKTEGIVTLDSGLQYTIVRDGHGRSPRLSDTVKIHYRGTRIDGREFSSSYRHDAPEEMAVKKLIPGLQEALVKMEPGAKWRVFIPSTMAFNEQTPLADQVVIFEIELLEVMPRE